MVYEIIGSREKAVAVIGYGAKNPEKIAKEIMKTHKNVKSVLVKTGERAGTYRLHPCKLILGDKNTEVIHKEHGYLIKIDPQKVYFSPRESTERQRIAKLVKPFEKVLIMFAGAGPFALAIKKARRTSRITCIEINPEAVKYADENVKLNKMRGIKNHLADVGKIDLGKFDRIIMPLPEKAVQFLDTACKFAKKGAIIHVYGFAKTEEELADEVKKRLEAFHIIGRIIGKQKVLPYGPGVYKIRIDIKIS